MSKNQPNQKRRTIKSENNFGISGTCPVCDTWLCGGEKCPKCSRKKVKKSS